MPAPPYPGLAGWPNFAGLTVERLLGRGGMAAVYAARTPAGDEVALKVIDPARAATVRQRLLTEARAAAAVAHPRLVRCLDVGEEQGHPFLVLELMPGGDGDGLLRRGRRLGTLILLGIAEDAASALAALHAAGVVHRDLKPSNLLFDAAGRAHIADFGLARLDDGPAGTTRQGFTVGTPEYMSPEQARAEPLDGRADLYALGATLYHLACGRPPHVGATAYATLGQVQSEPFPDVLRARPDLDPGLAAVIGKLGRKPLDERYADAGQVLDDLALVRRQRPPVHARFRSAPELAAAPDARTVLLIDDDAMARRIYGAVLQASGVRCRHAADGATGLAEAASAAPALAIVDLMLPDLDGCEVVAGLRRLHPALPIIVLSNAFDAARLHAAEAAGAGRVLAKSQTPPAALAATVRELIGGDPAGAGGPATGAEALAVADTALARTQVLLRRLDPAAEAAPVLGEVAAAARGLSTAAAAAGAGAVAALAAAVENMARELIAQPARRSASTDRTLLHAAEALRRLLAAGAAAPAPGRILVVDDDPMSRALLSAGIDRVGIPHDAIGSPAEALARLAGGGYALLVTDVMMAGISGFQLAARARQLPAHADLPILFVTALDDFPAFFTAGDRTGSDLLAKPFLLIELAVKVLTLLGRRPC